jgi:hypothetical protein
MRGTVNTSTEGRFCGRAVHGVSNLGSEQMREIEAHRAKDRPTPWAHLALWYGVNEIDLRGLFEASNTDVREPRAHAGPLTREELLARRDQRFIALWNADVPASEIMGSLGVSFYTVQKMRERLGLSKRAVGRPPLYGRGLAA